MVPAGAVEDTVPVPLFVTESVKGSANWAVTLRAWLIVTTQLPAPVQAPVHPTKTEPAFGVATSVTTVPCTTWTAHVLPQSRPVLSGELGATVPAPVPTFVTESAKRTGSRICWKSAG